MVLDAARLRQKPWLDDPAIPDRVHDAVGMIGPEERRCYWWLARNWLGERGCIVDAGAFVGASSAAFADGAAAAGRRSFRGRPLVHAFDYFSVVDTYVQQSISDAFRRIQMGDSYLPIYERQTRDYRDMIALHPGDFLSHRWDATPIEILFVDLAKTPELNGHVAAQFFPSLMPGHSLVLQQDYFHCWHPYIHITMEYLKDHFDLVDERVDYQTAVWLHSRPIPPEKIDRVARYDFDAAERLVLLDRLSGRSSAAMRPMIETVKLWQLCLDESYGAARHQLAAMDEAYGLRGNGALWARQALEIEALIPQPARHDTGPAAPPAAAAAPVDAINAHVSFDAIIADYPSFHRKPDGTPWFLGVSGDTLKALASHIEPGMRTIETGAGFSSLAFILKGARHMAICPDDDLEAAIRQWCDARGIDHSRFDYVQALSQDAAPALTGAFDFAFIDGDHAFPIPQIDFYYLARRLKVGGCLAIDDTHIWTGMILAQHLATDSDWRLESEHDGKTSIFRLVAPFRDKGFGNQPFVLANSRGLPQDYYSALKR